MELPATGEISPARARRPSEMIHGLVVPAAVRAVNSGLALARREWAVITLGFLAGFWAIFTSLLLFPYYSNNHDEPVYVLQAQMLLQGKLYLPADEFSDFFTPFFFVNDGERVFSKYTPVQAGFLALGHALLGSMRASLGLVAALTIVAFYLFALEIYSDRRVALKACVILLLSPFFLILSATFLPYTSGLMLLLVFGFLLLRGVRTGSTLCLVLSGLALGLTFFHRPYDALLFAVPFGLVFLVLHRNNLGHLARLGTPVFVGFTPFLILTLTYNAIITGDPLLFPFTFHEPLDKLGFGYRSIHPVNTPVYYGWTEAVESLWTNSAELGYWTFGGPLLLLAMLARWIVPTFQWQDGLLLLLLIAFPLGYFFFWGPYNTGIIWGAISYLGPYYYFPLLVPLALLGARGAEALFARNHRSAFILMLAMAIVAFALVLHQVSENYRYTEKSHALYQPFREHRISNALIFVPPLYGPFLLHPFAYLENTPLLDGPLLFAIDQGSQDFALMDHYPERQPYRFVYQGEYTEEPDDRFNTELVRIQRITTPQLNQDLRITNPTSSPYVYAYVWNDGRTETYLLDDSSSVGDVYDVRWTVDRQGVEFLGPDIRRSPSEIDAISPSHPITFAVAFSESSSRDSQVIFERRFSIRFEPDDTVEVIYPPEEWYNLDWPSGKWVRGNLGHVIEEVACSQC